MNKAKVLSAEKDPVYNEISHCVRDDHMRGSSRAHHNNHWWAHEKGYAFLRFAHPTVWPNIPYNVYYSRHNKLALPPAAVVLIVSVLSVHKRNK